jgi:exodeoxyribonuclease VII small subunit
MFGCTTVTWKVRLMPLSPKAESRSAPPVADAATALTFEDAYRELQQVVAQLEEGSLDLEAALRLYERGTELVDACARIVAAAELRVTRLAAESAAPLADAAGEF